MKTPIIICFEGIDGSGKTVQIQLLEHYLRANGHSVYLRSYPIYDSFFGRELGNLLADQKSDWGAGKIPPKTMALWYALDRWHDFQKNLAEVNCEYIILNRYTLSSIVYQTLRSQEPETLCEWILKLESEVLGLPQPHYYFIFDLPVMLANKNNMKKTERGYIASGLDAYEEDTNLQEKAREMYRTLGNRMKNGRIVNCFKQETMLSKEEIFAQVLSALKV